MSKIQLLPFGVTWLDISALRKRVSRPPGRSALGWTLVQMSCSQNPHISEPRRHLLLLGSVLASAGTADVADAADASGAPLGANTAVVVLNC